jgi:cobyric acid synthase CobQ
MSLNSFVTRTGGEMGRAQVVQAQACRLDPDVRMNPVLLKPNSDTGSQVIVMGTPVANMDVMEYVRFKPKAFVAAKEAYDSLASEYDAIVLEGAGSPAEVNLKHHDIVNMEMARHASAPVLLVGDIDRGGVFASFIGTMEVLEEWERAMIAGFVVNRFRGNEELLHDAIKYTKRHTGRPVFGVVPYFHDLGLPEEDSVSFKCGIFDNPVQDGDCVEIAVIDFPHISNFTDFDAFRVEPDVQLKIVRTASDLNQPDAVILPPKTSGDSCWTPRTGRQIGDLTATAHRLVDSAGGFQMSSDIADPHGLNRIVNTRSRPLNVAHLLRKDPTVSPYTWNQASPSKGMKFITVRVDHRMPSPCSSNTMEQWMAHDLRMDGCGELIFTVSLTRMNFADGS